MAVALILLVLLLSCHVCAGVGMCASLVRFSGKGKEKTYCNVALQTEPEDPQMTTVLVQQPDGDFFVSAL